MDAILQSCGSNTFMATGVNRTSLIHSVSASSSKITFTGLNFTGDDVITELTSYTSVSDFIVKI